MTKFGIVRTSVREKRPKHARWEVKDVLQADALGPFVGATWKPLADNKGASLRLRLRWALL